MEATASASRKRKRLKTTLAAAVAHPLRARCLTIFAERDASPSEIARELRLDVSNVGYHVNALADAKLIERVRTRPVRGATEHFYRAIELPVITGEQEKGRSQDERRTFAETTLSLYAANAARALEAGTMLTRFDHHLTRVAFSVDQQGWDELTRAYMELYEQVFEIQAASAKRPSNDAEPIRVISFQSLFEMPRGELDNDKPDTK
ncbi:MAG: helix-turn-helix transcriptional regulator [Actinobacteria bacterium]|nr:helix-turn-helix transcriptional regulator [Actinomycetota bacterium]